MLAEGRRSSHGDDEYGEFDMYGRADLLVSEIVDCGLCECLSTVLEHACFMFYECGLCECLHNTLSSRTRS
jgi:hypothetical protein